MKISGKIYSLVAIMGLASLLIGAIGIFVTLQYQAKTNELMNVSDRAYHGERLNRLVTAVVMEARGIYASKSTEAAAPFAKGILKALDDMDATLSEWRKLVPAEQVAAFQAVVDRSKEFRAFRAETARLGTEVSPADANAQGNNEANRANRKAFQAQIDAVVNADQVQLDALQQSLAGFGITMEIVLGVASLAAIAAGVGIGMFIGVSQLSRPILNLTNVIKRVADGDFEVEVPYTKRADEIGDMAQAVEVFKRNGQEVNRMNAQDLAMRTKSDDLQKSMSTVVAAAVEGDFSRRIDKQYDEPALDRFAGNINQLLISVESGVNETRRVVAALAHGDLTQDMRGDFRGAFAELQTNVNSTFQTLRELMADIRAKTAAISGNTGELNHATGDLARRTERQAAALEETSAALEEITAVVKNSSSRAQEATEMVTQAKRSAAQSGVVVRDAVQAMERIEQASREISSIINVIDEIAFQTNLLALNAGVEAARAGEAGKGFAVVAQEVRELAQRSANAAKDIKALITKSGHEVDGGVSLVQRTGEALAEIEGQVNEINDHIHSIATAAREQFTGLEEVNKAVNEMDQVTQQNAAMVEETSAATDRLSHESRNLVGLLAHFKVSGEDAHMVAAPVRAPAPAAAGARPAVSPARERIKSVVKAFSSPAPKMAVAGGGGESWEEF